MIENSFSDNYWKSWVNPLGHEKMTAGSILATVGIDFLRILTLPISEPCVIGYLWNKSASKISPEEGTTGGAVDHLRQRAFKGETLLMTPTISRVDLSSLKEEFTASPISYSEDSQPSLISTNHFKTLLQLKENDILKVGEKEYVITAKETPLSFDKRSARLEFRFGKNSGFAQQLVITDSKENQHIYNLLPKALYRTSESL